jgi:hypothetical protein
VTQYSEQNGCTQQGRGKLLVALRPVLGRSKTFQIVLAVSHFETYRNNSELIKRHLLTVFEVVSPNTINDQNG